MLHVEIYLRNEFSIIIQDVCNTGNTRVNPSCFLWDHPATDLYICSLKTQVQTAAHFTFCLTCGFANPFVCIKSMLPKHLFFCKLLVGGGWCTITFKSWSDKDAILLQCFSIFGFVNRNCCTHISCTAHMHFRMSGHSCFHF